MVTNNAEKHSSRADICVSQRDRSSLGVSFFKCTNKKGRRSIYICCFFFLIRVELSTSLESRNTMEAEQGEKLTSLTDVYMSYSLNPSGQRYVERSQ